MSLALAASQAIATSLSAGTFPSPFTGSVRFAPRREASDLAGITVDIIPAPQSRTLTTRAEPDILPNAVIVIDRQVDATKADVDLAQTDEVVTLAEAFCAYLYSRQLVTVGGTKLTVSSAELGDGVDLLDQTLLQDHLARCTITVAMRVQ